MRQLPIRHGDHPRGRKRESRVHTLSIGIYGAFVLPLGGLHGAIIAGNADGGFFVASGGDPQEAREFARKCAVELIDGPALLEMVWSRRRASLRHS